MKQMELIIRHILLLSFCQMNDMQPQKMIIQYAASKLLKTLLDANPQYYYNFTIWADNQTMSQIF